MSNIQNGNLSKLLLTIMLGICVALGGWNIKAAHDNSNDISVIRQIIVDQKEVRVNNQTETSLAFKRIEDRLIAQDLRVGELPELRLRLASAEALLKGLETQVIQLRLDTKGVDTRVANLEQSIKSVESQIIEIKAKVISMEILMTKLSIVVATNYVK